MSLPSFQEFYEDLHGYSPFPWQSRLAELVLQDGWNGLLLDLPTGVGKTTTLEIALYCLACSPDRLPRRTLLVVDRRVVVDQAAIGARKLQLCLDNAQQGPVFEIAQRLRKLGHNAAGDSCISVAVMRGGMPRENDWARTPDQPVLGLSTVDQVGSRILFRGYGLNPRSAPIHAGLIGNDTLILLDEVHLARPFQQTLEWIENRFQTPKSPLPQRFAVVPMSATAGPTSTRTSFSLSQEDWQDSRLSHRLETSKLARLQSVTVAGEEKARLQKLAEVATKEAVALQRAGARVVGVIVNRVETARVINRMLQTENHQSLLITGRMRALDRDRLTNVELIPRAGANRERGTETEPLFVVATQCIEAGADLDFDALVCECAALDALKQRFGRLDRRGELKTSHATILMRSDQIGTEKVDPIYGGALARTWEWLNKNASDEQFDFGIKALLDLETTNPPVSDLASPSLDAPVLMPAHLDGWVQTSPTPSPDSDPALWLHGPVRTQADVQILWRNLNPEPAVLLETQSVFQILDAIRPSSLETVSIPIGAAKRWLGGLAVEPMADVLSSPAAPLSEADVAAKDPVAYRWTGDAASSGWVTASELKPGQVFVVDCSRGGLANYSFDPESIQTVTDLGDLAQMRARGVASLRLTPANLEAIGLSPAPLREPIKTNKEYEVENKAWLSHSLKNPPMGNSETWNEWVPALEVLETSGRVQTLASGDYRISAKIPKAQRKFAAGLAESDTENDSSLFESEVAQEKGLTLRRHCDDVADFARSFATHLHFGPELVSDLALAGRLHDLGKADPRFQCWLAGGDEIQLAMNEALLAKSAFPGANSRQREAARLRAGYPKGYRHELLSLNMAEAGDLSQAHDRELVLHLIASHHGWCRPFAPLQDDPAESMVEWEGWSGTTRHRKASLDSGVAERFWSLVQHYGWWGLAWLESIIRLADHNASELREA